MVDDLQPVMSALSQRILATVPGNSGVSRARALETTGNVLAVRRMIETRSVLGVRNSAWDTHHHLLNTPAGVFDLRTGQPLGSNPSLLIRGITLVAPDMLDYGNWDLICPKWMKLLEWIAGDRPHIIPLLQRWWGDCFTGDLMHQHLLFMQGAPGTGKSVPLAVLLELANSYGQSLRQSFVLKSATGGDHRFDMDQIIGKRFGFSDEMMKNAPETEETFYRVKKVIE